MAIALYKFILIGLFIILQQLTEENSNASSEMGGVTPTTPTAAQMSAPNFKAGAKNGSDNSCMDTTPEQAANGSGSNSSSNNNNNNSNSATTAEVACS